MKPSSSLAGVGEYGVGQPNRWAIDSLLSLMRLLVNEESEPRFLAYVLGCVLGNLTALTVNSLWLHWPITWALFVAATPLALWGVFSIESGCEGCFVSTLFITPLALVLWWHPDFYILKQLWLAAVAGLFAGKMWVGLIR